MWQCPACGRSFTNTNQDHYCGEPPQTIDGYIEAQPAHVRPLLNRVRETLRAALPDAQERISWRMPTYWKGRNIIHFAAFTAHIGLYPGEKAMEEFADRLAAYKTSRGAIRLPLDAPLPLGLVEEIAKWCYETGDHH